MARLIDADALHHRMATLGRLARSDAQKALLGRALYIVDNMPTVDAEPVVHGEWDYDDLDDISTCSVCGKEWILNEKTPRENSFNYCPNCGGEDGW